MHPVDSKILEVSLFLDPEFQNKGWGIKALKKAIEFAKGLGFRTLRVEIKQENTRSKKFFQKLGFKYQKTFQGLEMFHLDLFGQFKRTYIIAEAGSNWMVEGKDHKEIAKQMIFAAKDAGCDAIKFQTFRKDKLYAKGVSNAKYLKKRGINETMETLFEKFEMPLGMVEWLYLETQKVGLDFLSSVFSRPDFIAVDPFVKMHKIASYELCHLELLECVAQTKKTCLLSTGAASMQDILWAKSRLSDNEVILMQCTAHYPTPIEDLNLNTLLQMKSTFKTPVGLSDHSMDLLAPSIAVSLGASVIEKHFTLSRQYAGPDHFFALEPDELKTMCLNIRKAEKMGKNFSKKVENVEKELFYFAKRRLHTTRYVKKGEAFVYKKNFDILRSGDKKAGLEPKYLQLVNGKIAQCDLDEGEGIEQKDVNAAASTFF